MIIFFILLLILAIIINIIITNSINENFANSPDKLVYLYSNNCPNCRNFNNTWITIENEVKANPFYYKFNTHKYNIDFESDGMKIARDNKINNPPEIIYISGDKYKIYKEKSTDMETILNWAKQINGM
jgi:hypothetical protein